MTRRRESKLAELSRLRDALEEELRTLSPDSMQYRDRAKIYAEYSARIHALKVRAEEQAFLRSFKPNKWGEMP